MQELAEGQVLADRYLLGPAAGHGAMGQVHLAEDIRLARPVAIKSLRPELARYPEVRQRFGQEARAAARISHPNVVRVYDSGEEGRIPYLVMECLPGSTLVDELAWGPLGPRRVRRVGLDVLGALDAAHRLGIVHRDVKPGNILLSAALDGPVKVSDFGIAKSADDRSLTDSGALVGTAAYLAPERVAGDPATPMSDLYSLGVVLYEAVAGRRPYEGDTSLAVALAIHMGGAATMLEVLPDVDPAFADVVDRAIARDPSERWASASEMAEALRAWRPDAVDGEPAGSDDDDATGAVPQVVRRRRPVAGTTGVAKAASAAPVAAPTEALAPAATELLAAPSTDTPTPGATELLSAAATEAPVPTEVLAAGPAVAAGPPRAHPHDAPATAADGRRRVQARVAPAGGAAVRPGPRGSAGRAPSPPIDGRRARAAALGAGAVGLLLLVLLVVMTRGDDGGTEPVPPPTTVDPVAPATAPTQSDSSVARTPSSVARTTAAPRRTVAPTTVAPRAPVATSTTVQATTITSPPTTAPPTTTAPSTVPPPALTGPPAAGPGTGPGLGAGSG